MQEIVDFICNGETEFTIPVIVGLLVFSMVLECIGSVAYAVTSVGRR